MSILLTCTCGKKLKVNEDKIGKKVKCPGCQSILSVPAAEAKDEPEPPAKARPKPPPPEDDLEAEAPPKTKPKPPPPEEDEAPEPPRKGKPKPPPPESDEDEDEEVEKPAKEKKKTPAAPKDKSRLGFYIVVAVILLIAGCGGGGLALWYAFETKLFGTSNPPMIPKTDSGKPATDKDKGAGKLDKDAVIEPRARFTADKFVQGDPRTLLLLSQDGSMLAVNGTSKSQVWDIAGEPKKRRDFDGTIHAFSPDGKRLVQSTPKGMSLLDVESGAEIAPIRLSATWFASNSVLWCFGNSLKDAKGRKRISATSFDAVTGKQIKELEIDDKGDRRWGIDSKGELVFVSEAREVNFWDSSAEKWTRQLSLKPDAGAKLLLSISTSTTVSSDGKWLLVPAGKFTFDAAAFDLATGDGFQIPKQQMGTRTPAFVPNRDILMVNRSEGAKKDTLLAYALKAKAVVATFGTVQTFVNALAISVDGSTMVAGSSDGEVVIWDLKKLP